MCFEDRVNGKQIIIHLEVVLFFDIINFLSLSSSFIYHMSIYLLPKTIVDNLDKQRRKFFWQGGTRRKYHLVKWDAICKSMPKGGLGVKNISKMNIGLLCKWWWKLEREEGVCGSTALINPAQVR